MAKAVDLALGATGLALAAAAVWFPWHVYMTPQDYGPPRMAFERIGPTPEVTIEAHMAALDDMLRGSVAGRAPLGGNIDMTMTGSVDDKPDDRILPVPEVVVAATGRALVRQGAMLDLWRVGSVTEDGRRVVSIEMEDGRMVVRLDDGMELTIAPRSTASRKSR